MKRARGARWLGCVTVVCGTAAATGSTRDTDRYRLNLTGFGALTAIHGSVTPEFDVRVAIIDGNAGCNNETIQALHGPAAESGKVVWEVSDGGTTCLSTRLLYPS